MVNRRDGDTSGGRLNGDEVARLTDHIARLTATGLPLPSGIRALREELPGRRFGKVLDRLAAQLESGLSLEESLAQQGDKIPPHLRGVVMAGSRSGKLGEVLGRFAGYANVGVELRRSLWIKLAYPMLTLALACMVYIFISVVLMNGFLWIFRDFGIPMPLLTQFIFKISEAVSRAWKQLAAGAVGLLALGSLATLVLRTELRRGLGWAIPLIGPVWHYSDLAEFSHLLALLVESEVPLLEALPMAGSAVQNSEIASGAKQAAHEVSEGSPLAQALIRSSLYPRSFLRILEWAETHRGLSEALHMMGEMFEARARSQATVVSLVCNTLALLSVIGGVACLVIGVFLPMIQLLQKLSG